MSKKKQKGENVQKHPMEKSTKPFRTVTVLVQSNLEIWSPLNFDRLSFKSQEHFWKFYSGLRLCLSIFTSIRLFLDFPQSCCWKTAQTTREKRLETGVIMLHIVPSVTNFTPSWLLSQDSHDHIDFSWSLSLHSEVPDHGKCYIWCYAMCNRKSRIRSVLNLH